MAASEGKVSAVKFLIEQGVDTNAQDRWGYTPMAEAETNRNGQVMIYKNLF